MVELFVLLDFGKTNVVKLKQSSRLEDHNILQLFKYKGLEPKKKRKYRKTYLKRILHDHEKQWKFLLQQSPFPKLQIQDGEKKIIILFQITKSYGTVLAKAIASKNTLDTTSSDVEKLKSIFTNQKCLNFFINCMKRHYEDLCF